MVFCYFFKSGFTRWDVKLGWQENVQRKWTLAVRNLTDVDYVTYTTGAFKWARA